MNEEERRSLRAAAGRLRRIAARGDEKLGRMLAAIADRFEGAANQR